MIRLAALAVLCLLPVAATAEALRVATFNTELSRKGPGLMLRDIAGGRDTQVAAVVSVIAFARPDILALQGLDWDHEGRALDALAVQLAAAGWEMAHRFAAQPNSGRAINLDLDGDGRIGGPGDAQGYGRFSGQGGIAILSRHPIAQANVQDFSALLWRDLPGATLPESNGYPFPTAEAQAVQRLASTGHWLVPIDTDQGSMVLLTYQAGPPVFDGPEDRNGLRNRDETRFWQLLLDGAVGTMPDLPFVLAGGANLDPQDGEGHHGAIETLLTDPRLQDPAPVSPGAAKAGSQGHRGPDAQDTVDWPGIGRFRVDYVLPSIHWRVTGSGVIWPTPEDPSAGLVSQASRHRLVWVDLIRE
ncbi:endonuclease/exonuclease/phosphatase family protein [Ruegeria pomeroyi]|nr:endonuclease/exonuclease/phosphatase family protein [Ruegeria pomeroyi]MCE8523224.1 endonuclease/exonuclease/phosphatase family protein [Ruegeria pomeroyi]MCE8527330.1 endonuclease/exonuclease/phosphatase family protein [Ruegeria pomeroyi]MCE8531368.1 endonuclease/exonuclease/phosphatase family protein [Ruegeria pomeroyi]MCE8535510.1 endonuclease/exonuclease/phosphatase family protein [Ruegeria pomeroyi]